MSILEALSDALNQAMRQHSAPPQSPQADATEPRAAQAQSSGSLSEILASAGLSGLAGVAERLSAGGLGDQVRSWLGSGANMPVTGEQVRSALGDEKVQHIARQLGIPADSILQILSHYLPGAVDEASPHGQVEEPRQSQR
jgi:uncharacterized protein YidB (DUF937 family)